MVRVVRLLPVAWHRWGLIGTCERVFLAWRGGGPSVLVEKLRLLAVEAAREGARKSEYSQEDALDELSRAAEYPATPDVIQGINAGEILLLDSDFGVGRTRWDAFLSRRATASLGQEDAVSPTTWVLVQNDTGSLDVDETLRSIEKARLARQNVRVVSRTESFSSLLGSLLAKANSDDFIWFARAGDEIDISAVQLVAQAAARRADLCLFDTYFFDGDRAFPQLHPGFNPIFGLNCNYFRSRFIARAGSVRRILNNSLPHDAYSVARAMMAAHLDGKGIVGMHLARPLVQINDSRADMADESRDLLTTERKLEFGAGPADWHDVGDRKTSIVICTRDKGHLLRQLIRNIFDTGGDLVQEVLIVKHATTSPYAVKTLADLSGDRRVRILNYGGAFNFSRQCNHGAQNASAPYLLFLNDDMTPVAADWLPQLLLPFQNPEVGMTGPLLLYPDESVQQAGMFLGFMNTAGHTLRHAQLPSGDYLFMTQAPREVSCLTGAAVAIERGLFSDLNGFDPLLGSYLQDVDLGLRVNRLGRRVIFNPYSILLHMESTSIRKTLGNPAVRAAQARERAYFWRRWGDPVARDLFHNPSFHPNMESLRAIRMSSDP